MSHTHLRIFVASPGDVADERKAIKGIVDEVEKLLQKERAISLDLVMWETDSRPAAGEPQPNINEQIGDYDIFIGLLWKRFGTPTTKAGSGTEEEFNLAYERWLKSEEKPKRPDILFYFCKKPFYPDSDEEHEQFGKVLAFRRKHQKSNFFWVYETVDQFKDELRGHLFDTVVARVPLRSAERTETLRAALPSSQTRSLYLQRLASHCRHLPLGAMGSDNDEAAVTLDQVYISLDTTSRQQELAGMGGADDKENPPLSALEAFERNPRLVLLGHPGSGKSTFVNEVLARYAIALQDDTAEPPAGLPRTLTPVKIVLRDFAGRLAAFDDAKLSAKKRRAALADLFRDQAVADLAQFKAADFADGIAAAFETGHCLLVLDGLDEVPPASRVRMRMAVAALLEHFTIRHCIVTCRVRSYQDADTKIAGFVDHTLAPLNDEQKERFAHQWYHTSPQLERLGAEKADTRSKRLTEAAKRRELRDIAGNPMLLTTMAIIHQRDIELPDERARLYHLAVDVMLRRWQRHKVGDEEPSAAIAAFLGSEDRLREAMQRIAYEAHASPAGDDGLADLNRDEAINILKDNKYLGSYAAAEGFLDYADKKSGLLLGRGGDAETPDTYGFPHRTFQEYLAGCYIVSRPNVQGELVTHAEKGDFWYVAVQLGLEEMFYNNKRTWEVLRLAYAFCQDECPEPVHEQRLVLWAGFIANLVKPTFILEDTQTKGGGAAFLARLKAQLVQILRGTLPATERVESGRLLGFLGDPRPEVMDVDQMEFCYVPAGEVLMGTDEKNPISSSDLPQEELDLFGAKGDMRLCCPMSSGSQGIRYQTLNTRPS
ncbi:MAG: DUF4062 domain-containing protein [Rhodothermales bacterium]